MRIRGSRGLKCPRRPDHAGPVFRGLHLPVDADTTPLDPRLTPESAVIGRHNMCLAGTVRQAIEGFAPFVEPAVFSCVTSNVASGAL